MPPRWQTKVTFTFAIEDRWKVLLLAKDDESDQGSGFENVLI